MDKKTKTIVIIVAVVVVGGLVMGINRWQQQRAVRQYFKTAQGIETGLLNKITGGGITKEIAKEIAKEESNKVEEGNAEEAKTPADIYNATEEMTAYDADSKALVTSVRSIVEKVFGKAKLTTVATNIYGVEMTGSGFMEFEIARLATGADLAVLNKELTGRGLPIMQSGISDKTAMVVAGNDETSVYTFGFEVGGQKVGISVLKAAQ